MVFKIRWEKNREAFVKFARKHYRKGGNNLIMKFLGEVKTEELLILTKTYPYPSMNYRETSCVAAINNEGSLRRLYPIPYRFLEKEKQFKKWEWISAKIDRSSDKRPESHRIDVESIQRGQVISTKNNWANRIQLIEYLFYPSFEELEKARSAGKCSLGFIRPTNICFSMKPEKTLDWTHKELVHLQKEGLFDSEDIRNRNLLKKLPFQFRYSFMDNTDKNPRERNFLITDWEIGALFWRCQKRYGKDWEQYFRNKFEIELPSKDLIFMLGTIHQYPDEWLIIGLIYPPKPKPGLAIQPSLI
jgi:hypothetical protein